MSTLEQTPETHRAADRGPRELSHLGVLEAEAIHVFREAVAEFERPVQIGRAHV